LVGLVVGSFSAQRDHRILLYYPSRFPKIDSDFRAMRLSGRQRTTKTGIAFAKPVTECKRPFSELFNVAASRPAKSPRDFAFLLGPPRLGVNGQSLTLN
jgi:hypothetical protein